MKGEGLREKVIKGLECCSSISVGIKTCGYIPTQNDCPYCYLIEEDWNGCDSHIECTNALAADALKLLKELEPRVLKYEQIKGIVDGVVWVELNGRKAVEPWIVHQGEIWRPDYNTGYECWEVCQENEYNRIIRCWSSEPTNEQRKAVKWDG